MNEPLRLQRPQQKHEPRIIEVLNSDIVLRIKFYLLLFGAMALFVLICFMLQPQTYGFFNW